MTLLEWFLDWRMGRRIKALLSQYEVGKAESIPAAELSELRMRIINLHWAREEARGYR